MKKINNGILVSRQQQQGVSTLIFVILIMLLTLIATNNSFNFVRLEQKLSNNNGRALQSFEAAEAGMSATLAYMGNGGVVGGNVYGASNTAAVGDGSVVVSTAPSAGTAIALLARGYSDDRSATHTVTQYIDLLDPLPAEVYNPLTAGSQIGIGGSATIYNPEGQTTMWSGDEVDVESNNSSATYIPDPSAPGYPACMEVAMTCQLVDSSSKKGVGLDVIENDTSLAALSADDMFFEYFGMTPDQYRNSPLVTTELTGANGGNVDGMTHEVVWIEGNTVLQGTTAGCNGSANGNINVNSAPYTMLCADVQASIVIINGDVEFKGNPSFYGLVFVLGDVVMAGGNTSVTGAMVVTGDMSGGGSLDLWFNSEVLANTDLAGNYVGVAGTWKDF